MNISIIIPAFQEENNPFFIKSIEQLIRIGQIEILIVCFEKDFNTINLINQFKSQKISIINSKINKRGYKINLGISFARYDFIFVNHPRSIIDPCAIEYLKTVDPKPFLWGGLTHSFDKNDLFYRFTSFYSNFFRTDLFGIIYLDHCLFFNKMDVIKLNGFPETEIFEDTIFSIKMRDYALPTRLPFKSKTSAIRFQKNGKIKQSLMNFKLKILFLTSKGINDYKMNQEYEKNLNLNN